MRIDENSHLETHNLRFMSTKPRCACAQLEVVPFLPLPPPATPALPIPTESTGTENSGSRGRSVSAKRRRRTPPPTRHRGPNVPSWVAKHSLTRGAGARGLSATSPPLSPRPPFPCDALHGRPACRVRMRLPRWMLWAPPGLERLRRPPRNTRRRWKARQRASCRRTTGSLSRKRRRRPPWRRRR